MSESPVRDREQAITRIADILPLDVFPYKTRREYAERIVDALLPQPDPEVERLRIVERSLMENLNAALADLERAEERLRAVGPILAAARAVGEAHRAVIEGVTPRHPNSLGPSPEHREEYDARFSAWHRTTYALRTVLSSHPEAQSTEERT